MNITAGGLLIVIALLRTIILHLSIIVGIRLMGKRQTDELELSELMLALLIVGLAAAPMQGFSIPLPISTIPTLTPLCLTMALSVLTMKSVRFRVVFYGRPSTIVESGKFHQREMQKSRFTADELMEELCMKGITDLNSTKYATLKIDRQIFVLPYAAQQFVTATQMELHLEEPGLSLVIVNDDRMLEYNLHRWGLDDIWLDRQLKAHHVKRSQDMFLLIVDEQNQVYLAEKEGWV